MGSSVPPIGPLPWYRNRRVLGVSLSGLGLVLGSAALAGCASGSGGNAATAPEAAGQALAAAPDAIGEDGSTGIESRASDAGASASSPTSTAQGAVSGDDAEGTRPTLVASTTSAISASIVDPQSSTSSSATSTSGSASESAATPEGSAASQSAAARPAPAWLGQRTLPTTPDGSVVVPQTTPTELRGRRLVTSDTLLPPAGSDFTSSIEAVPADVLARSTWHDGCPVGPDDLAYVTVSFWGFDQEVHTGELLVHRDVASDIAKVFEQIYRARFPIEEMRIVTPADLDAPPTGDGNNTTAFVCRAVTGGTTFSQHAYGLAVDINPFHNPYQKGDLILPELAGHYLERSIGEPGMMTSGGPVVEAFDSIGWGWGGRWRSLKDYHHFSQNNR